MGHHSHYDNIEFRKSEKFQTNPVRVMSQVKPGIHPTPNTHQTDKSLADFVCWYVLKSLMTCQLSLTASILCSNWLVPCRVSGVQ